MLSCRKTYGTWVPDVKPGESASQQTLNQEVSPETPHREAVTTSNTPSTDWHRSGDVFEKISPQKPPNRQGLKPQQLSKRKVIRATSQLRLNNQFSLTSFLTNATLSQLESQGSNHLR
jgi:hypothetical protein